MEVSSNLIRSMIPHDGTLLRTKAILLALDFFYEEGFPSSPIESFPVPSCKSRQKPVNLVIRPSPVVA